MIESQIPYLLYALGGLISILLLMAGVPTLPFALGMYLPIQINMPVFIGGFLSYLLQNASKKVVNNAGEASPFQRGTLIASGFIAGGALMGVVGAVLNLPDIGKPIRFISIGAKYISRTVAETGQVVWDIGSHARYFETIIGQFLSLAGFISLCLFCYYYAKGKKAK
jgi:hypothetical protein